MAHLEGGRVLAGQLFQLRRHGEDLEDAATAPVPRAAAVAAALAAAQGHRAPIAGREAGLEQILGLHLEGFGALVADHLHQSLGEAAEQGRGDHERLQAEVAQAGDGGDRVVGMQGGKDEMPGHRRLHGMGGGFVVADLADHDDVRVLAQDVAQNGGEGDVDERLDGDLVELLVDHLHRVLDGDDVLLRGGDLLQGRIEGGRLAAAGRAGHQDDAVRRGHERPEDIEVPLREAEVLHLLEDHVRIEDTHHHLLAEGNRHRGDADLDVFAAPLPHLDAAVLGAAFFGDIHARQELDARGDRRVYRLGQVVDGVQAAVDAEAHHRHAALGLDMDVAGALLEGVMEDMVDRRLDMLVGGGDLLGGGDLHIALEVADVDRGGSRRDHPELVLGGADRVLKTEKFGDDALDIGLGGEIGANPHLIGLLDVGQGGLAVGVVDGGLQDPLLELEGQDHLADGEVARDGLGGYLHVEVEGVELLEGQLLFPGDGLDDRLLVDEPALAARQLEVEGGDDVHHVREVLVDLAFAPGRAEQLLPHLAFFEEHELALFGGEEAQVDQKVEEFVALQEFHCRLLGAGKIR